jgi:hypothetical protein
VLGHPGLRPQEAKPLDKQRGSARLPTRNRRDPGIQSRILVSEHIEALTGVSIKLSKYFRPLKE